jgi:hypothetical protein
LISDGAFVSRLGDQFSVADDLDSACPEGVENRLSFPQQPEVVHAEGPFGHDDRLKIETTRTCLESYMEVVVGNLQVTPSPHSM